MNFEAMNEEMKQQIMAYLYGEMTIEEKRLFEEELNRNESLQYNLAAIKSTQKILGRVKPEEEVTPPPFFQLMNEEKKSNTSAFRWVGSIAAALLILLIAGRITGLSISSNQAGIQLSFNQTSAAIDQDSYVAKEAVDQMIQTSLAAYDAKLNQQLSKRAEKQEEFINEQFDDNRSFLDNSVQTIAANNKNLLKEYWQQSNQQQQQYMTSLMGEFTNYVEKRRNEDMQYMMAKINLLETDNDLLELETNQLKNTYALNTENNTY